jgi:hypothetical protein
VTPAKAVREESAVDAVRRWAEGLTQWCRRQSFAGLYLTGSVSTGGFHSGVSDVDLVIVVDAPLDADVLTELQAVLLDLGPPPAAGGLDFEPSGARLGQFQRPQRGL